MMPGQWRDNKYSRQSRCPWMLLLKRQQLTKRLVHADIDVNGNRLILYNYLVNAPLGLLIVLANTMDQLVAGSQLSGHRRIGQRGQRMRKKLCPRIGKKGDGTKNGALQTMKVKNNKGTTLGGVVVVI